MNWLSRAWYVYKLTSSIAWTNFKLEWWSPTLTKSTSLIEKCILFLSLKLSTTREGRLKETFKINLQAKWCDCRKFPTFHVPCSHAIGACSNFNHDYQRHIHQVYRNESVFNVYNIRFKVIQHPSYWIQYEAGNCLPRRDNAKSKKGLFK